VNRACSMFLRDLEGHASAVEAGGESVHARQCQSCAGHLAAAVHQVRLLRFRPKSAAGLSHRSVLEGILERAIEAMETTPAGEALSRELAAVPSPGDLPWPDARDPGRDLARDLAVRDHVVPRWVWLRVQDDVRAELRRRVSLRRRRIWLTVVPVSMAAAGLVLSLVLSGIGPGPSPEPEIVMQRLAHSPETAHSPAAVLRLGGGR
jgi:hypothetical protein